MSRPSIENLCLISGPWQLLVVSAALRTRDEELRQPPGKSVLVILIKGGQHITADWIQSFAPVLYPWEKICVFREEEVADYRGQWPMPTSDLFETIYSRVGVASGGSVKNIWLAMWSSFEERLFLEAFPRSRIMIYEDGVLTYHCYTVEDREISRQWSPWRRWRSILRGTWKQECVWHRLHTWRISPAYLARLSESRLLLGKALPVPECLSRSLCQIEPSVLLAQYARLRSSVVSKGLLVTGKRLVLVIPQVFYRVGQLSAEREQEVYVELVEELVERGFCVVWKDHPRSLYPMRERLQEQFGESMVPWDIPQEAPLDAFLVSSGIHACVSGYSSTLFYAKYIYDLPAYTFAGRIVDEIPVDRQWPLRLTMEHIPDYRELLGEGGGARG